MKTKVSIKLATIGIIKRDINFSKIIKHNSKIFDISKSVNKIELLPNLYDEVNGTYELTFKKKDFERFNITDLNYDITVGIIDYQIDDNFYMRRISNNTLIISIYEIPDLLQEKEIPIENFILKCIYEAVSFYVFKNSQTLLNSDIDSLIHGETRRCLYDMNGNKIDISFSTEKVGFCDGCIAKLKEQSVPVQSINIFKSELKRIKLPLYVRLKKFVKKHTLISLVISLFATISISVLSNFLYELLKTLII